MHYYISCFGTLETFIHCKTTNITSTYTLTCNISKKYISHVLQFLQKELIPFQYQRVLGNFKKFLQRKSILRKHLLLHIRIRKGAILKKYIIQTFRTQEVISIRKSI